MMERLDVRVTELQQHLIDGAMPHTDATVGTDYILVMDDVLPDPRAYREAVLTLSFRSIPMGPVTFHGIAECHDPYLPLWITARFPAASPGLTFFRRSPLGQVEPNFIHTDRDMGDWTGILYLNPDPPAEDGTTFFRHRGTGATASHAATEDQFHQEWRDWRDLGQWEPWRTVSARFNRLLLFHAPMFHARALPDNYGQADTARLIQLVFGTGALTSCVMEPAPPSD